MNPQIIFLQLFPVLIIQIEKNSASKIWNQAKQGKKERELDTASAL